MRLKLKNQDEMGLVSSGCILMLSLISLHLYFSLKIRPVFYTILLFSVLLLLVIDLREYLTAELFYTEEFAGFKTSFPFRLFFGPILYFLLKTADRETSLSRSEVTLHLLPLLLWLPVFVFLAINPNWRMQVRTDYFMLLHCSVFLSCFSYSAYSFKKISEKTALERPIFISLIVLIIIIFVHSLFFLGVIYYVHILQNEVLILTTGKVFRLMRIIVVSGGTWLLFLRFLQGDPTGKTIFTDESSPLYPIRTDLYTETLLSPERIQEYIRSFEEIIYDQEYYLNKKAHLSGIAAKMDIPAQYLTQVLSRTYEMGLPEIINRLRVKHACSLLLKNPESTMAEIAESSGFSSESTFFRNFKDYINTTPAQFRMSGSSA